VDSGAEAIIVVENFAHVVEAVMLKTALKHVVTTQIGDMLSLARSVIMNLTLKHVKRVVPRWRIHAAVSFREALRWGAHNRLDERNLVRGDIALLQYTGGTTGEAKGAMLTHGNLLANVWQVGTWWDGVFEIGAEVWAAPLPLYHVMCFMVTLFAVRIGGLSLLITNPRDAGSVLEVLRKHHPTGLSGVNTLFNGLLNTPGFADLDFSQLRTVLGGGAAINHDVARRWRDTTGCPITEVYGLTEASPLVTANRPGCEYTGTTLPVPSTDVAVRDEQGRDLMPGGEGEICVRGPQIMRGYWNRPEATTAAISNDGWLRTGDVGVMDERGYLRITDRKNDMIIVSGFNVYPNEIEGIIVELPGVLECGVVGIPDKKSGEVVKAFIVRRNPSLSADDVIEYCRRYLTGYKVPKLVEFCDALPKTPVGKVLRRELRSRSAK
jgi:long-chain acyl-CoA synthetase